MKRLILVLVSLLSLAGAAQAQTKEEDVSIRGNFPQLLAQGETIVQMSNRIAVLLINLDRLIAPPCGMKRIFVFAGADHVDVNDVSRRLDPAQPGVWRLVVQGKGCWTPRTHNIFVFPRGASPAELRLGVPGGSSAGVKHQQDATRMILREANSIAAHTNCDERAFIVDTAVTKPRRPGQAWTESWTTSACEVQRKFTVTFAPEAGKMRIMVVPGNY
jgi:hypothetical protein